MRVLSRYAGRTHATAQHDQGDDRRSDLHCAHQRCHENAGGRLVGGADLHAARPYRADGRSPHHDHAHLQARRFIQKHRAQLERMEHQRHQLPISGRAHRGPDRCDRAVAQAEVGVQSGRGQHRAIAADRRGRTRVHPDPRREFCTRSTPTPGALTGDSRRMLRFDRELSQPATSSTSATPARQFSR